MPHFFKLTASAFSIALLAACVDDAGEPMAETPTEAEQACLLAVGIETGNPDYVLLESSYSEAGTEVIVGVGPQRARWQCIAYSDGTTSRPMSMTDEGAA